MLLPFDGKLCERHCRGIPPPTGHTLPIVSNSLRLMMSSHPNALYRSQYEPSNKYHEKAAAGQAPAPRA